MPQYQLMQHQKDAVAFLDSVDGIGALLFDPGTGKTGSALSWIDSLAARQKVVRVLVVAPLTAADTWVLQAPPFMDSPVKARLMQGTTKSILAQIAEAHDWTTVPDTKIMENHPGALTAQLNGQQVTLLSMSAGAVSSFCSERAKTVQMLKAIRKYAPHIVVLDESHIAKSATANISKAMYQIGQLAPHRIIATGTVTPHSPLDVYGQWRFLAPWTFSDDHGKKFTLTPLKMTLAQAKSIRPWPWLRFKTRYTFPGGYKGKGIGGFQNLDDLNARVAERSMVVKSRDVLDMPPVQDIPVRVQLSPKEQRAYDDMRRHLAAEMEDGSLLEAPNPLAKMMKLRQITAGFAVDSEAGKVHVIGKSKQNAIVEVTNTTLAGEQRVVVFAYFRPECAALADALQTPGTTVEVITGATKADERLAIRKRFLDVSGNPGRMVLVAQARTMSVSVNELITAQHAVFGSLSERRDDWVQARYRLERHGQQGSSITFWNVGVPDSVDTIMLENHKERGDLERSMLDYIKATPR